jgi:phosphate transport system permease protein
MVTVTERTLEMETVLPADHRKPTEAEPTPRDLTSTPSTGDRVFRLGMGSTGLLVLVLMGAVGFFLTIEATDALRVAGFGFLTTQEWQPETGTFGIAGLLFFTVVIALIAVCVALPIALGTSLFITEIAPNQIKGVLVAMVDLMAAVPSVVYGLWGLKWLQGQQIGISEFINTWFGWIPIFDVAGADPGSPLSSPTVYTSSSFIAGTVVAMMVIPIQATVMREVFSQVPSGEREGAYALGSSRWGMIRAVALPFGRGGIIGGTMLGLGRALGETIAILLIMNPRFDVTFNVLENGTNSIAAHIALRQPEAQDFSLSALMAAGLALFGITLVVNFVASGFIARSRSGASSEG